MERDSITAAYEQAKTLVAGISDDRYQSVAFEVVFKRLLDGAGQLPIVAHPGSSQVVEHRIADIAVGEFLALTQSKSYPDKVMVIALYYLRARGDDSVTRSDLLDAFSKARIPKPKNLSDVIAQAVRRGHLMDADPKSGQKAWKITITGEKYAEEKLLLRG